jgi:hypothetical protein
VTRPPADAVGERAAAAEGDTPGVQTLAEEAEALAAAPDAAPVPADEVPAVVAGEADDQAAPRLADEHRIDDDQNAANTDPNN